MVIAFFPVTLSMLAGMRIGRTVADRADAFGRRRAEPRSCARIQVPHSLPNLMAGLKIAATFSVIGAIVGEFAGASAGLGYMIQFASTQLDTPWCSPRSSSSPSLGVGFYYLVEYLEKLLVPWAPKFTRS